MVSRGTDYASSYYTQHDRFLGVKSPEYLSLAQFRYISDLFQGFDDAIYSSNGYNRQGKHYSEYIDMQSLVCKYMLEEIVKNFDGSRTSQYFYKPSDSISTVAFAGPAWDYDCSLGGFARNEEKVDTLNPAGFLTSKSRGDGTWWGELYKYADFRAAISETYASRYRPALSILLGEHTDPTGKLRSIDAYADHIAASANMNFVRWHITRKGVADCGKTWQAQL